MAVTEVQGQLEQGERGNLAPEERGKGGQPLTIAIDAMSGDWGAPVVIEALARMDREALGARLVLMGDQGILEPLLARSGLQQGDRLMIEHAPERVEMDDAVSVALRSKRLSSMRLAIDWVHSGRAAACISAGNTGALMVTARRILRTIPGIDRPAIVTALPAPQGRTYVLDLGANAECTSEHLFQFAVMGSVLVAAVENIPAPRVGLMNVGAEQIKGAPRVRQAGRLLEASGLNYVGFVEGDAFYSGQVDVLVCDGFSGNAALKASESVARLIAHRLKASFQGNLYGRMVGLLAWPALRAFRRQVDPRYYNGATLLGLRGIVVKSHGSADSIAFANAIEQAAKEARMGIPERIGKLVGRVVGMTASMDVVS
jgi:glycerol-3-phosphate acyltransferase PlsX